MNFILFVMFYFAGMMVFCAGFLIVNHFAELISKPPAFNEVMMLTLAILFWPVATVVFMILTLVLAIVKVLFLLLPK